MTSLNSMILIYTIPKASKMTYCILVQEVSFFPPKCFFYLSPYRHKLSALYVHLRFNNIIKQENDGMACSICLVSIPFNRNLHGALAVPNDQYHANVLPVKGEIKSDLFFMKYFCSYLPSHVQYKITTEPTCHITCKTMYLDLYPKYLKWIVSNIYCRTKYCYFKFIVWKTILLSDRTAQIKDHKAHSWAIRSWSTMSTLCPKGHWIAHSSLTLYKRVPTFNDPWERSLLKTFWEKEKMLVTSIFSFYQNVFYPS